MNIIKMMADQIPQLKEPKKKSPRPFSFLVIYDNQHAAQSATQLIERLGKKHQDKIEPHIRPLSMECMSSRSHFNRAFAEANRADMIFVAISGLGSLPSRLRKLICHSSSRVPIITYFEIDPVKPC